MVLFIFAITDNSEMTDLPLVHKILLLSDLVRMECYSRISRLKDINILRLLPNVVKVIPTSRKKGL